LIAIFFNIVESSVNYIFEDDKPPTPLWEKVLSYALGEYKIFIDSFVVKTSKGLIFKFKTHPLKLCTLG
jgi:hypothetical protein